ncbi:hypothetical protein AOLI_G00053630 [Acnodon oligacanthus]
MWPRKKPQKNLREERNVAMERRSGQPERTSSSERTEAIANVTTTVLEGNAYRPAQGGASDATNVLPCHMPLNSRFTAKPQNSSREHAESDILHALTAEPLSRRALPALGVRAAEAQAQVKAEMCGFLLFEEISPISTSSATVRRRAVGGCLKAKPEKAKAGKCSFCTKN